MVGSELFSHPMAVDVRSGRSAGSLQVGVWLPVVLRRLDARLVASRTSAAVRPGRDGDTALGRPVPTLADGSRILGARMRHTL